MSHPASLPRLLQRFLKSGCMDTPEHSLWVEDLRNQPATPRTMNERDGICCRATNPILQMSLILAVPVAAIGWSILYMILGGGLVGAIVIFIIAKMFRR